MSTPDTSPTPRIRLIGDAQISLQGEWMTIRGAAEVRSVDANGKVRVARCANNGVTSLRLTATPKT